MSDSQLSLEEYKIFVEGSSILIWRADTQGERVYSDRQWLALTGRPWERAQGNGWTESIHPDDQQRCRTCYFGAFKKREAFEMEYRLRRYDGTYRWIRDGGVPIVGPGGDFRGYVGCCTDVTEKVEADGAQQIAQSEDVKWLRGLLPICSSCKRIRDHNGDWNETDACLNEDSKGAFSQGLCPKCLKTLYPEFADD